MIYSNDQIPPAPHKVAFDIRIEGRSSDAKFFMRTPFKREDLQGDDKDFQWLLDLEAPPFATGKQHRKEDKFSTQLTVGNGTFYTYKHTGSTFYYINSKGKKHKNSKGKKVKLGYVPKVMAVDIPLQNGECLSFKLGANDVLSDPICGGQKHEIFFLNEYDLPCSDKHNKKCLENDFGMVFDAFENYTAFDLLLDQDHDNGPTNDLCIPLPAAVARLTDEAPCMGGGFGGGGGFP
jgi:hypothetical protein